MTIAELQSRSHQLNVKKGFHDADTPENLLTFLDRRLLLVVGEVIEAQNEIRAGHAPTAVYYLPTNPTKPEGFGIELADVVIRTAALAELMGIDLEACIGAKHEYNLTRPYKHEKAF